MVGPARPGGLCGLIGPEFVPHSSAQYFTVSDFSFSPLFPDRFKDDRDDQSWISLRPSTGKHFLLLLQSEIELSSQFLVA